MKKTSSKLNLATTAAATFGTAMSTLFVANDLHAEIVELTFNGGNASTTNPFHIGCKTLDVVFDIDQVPNVDGTRGDFSAWNDTFQGTGRTHGINGTDVAGNLLSHRPLSSVGGSLFIDHKTFVGDSDGFIGDGSSNIFDGSGTAFVGFRTAAGNVGWYQMSFSVAGPVRYFSGQLGTNGESIFIFACSCCPAEIGDINERRSRRSARCIAVCQRFGKQQVLVPGRRQFGRCDRSSRRRPVC